MQTQTPCNKAGRKKGETKDTSYRTDRGASQTARKGRTENLLKKAWELHTMICDEVYLIIKEKHTYHGITMYEGLVCE